MRFIFIKDKINFKLINSWSRESFSFASFRPETRRLLPFFLIILSLGPRLWSSILISPFLVLDSNLIPLSPFLNLNNKFSPSLSSYILFITRFFIRPYHNSSFRLWFFRITVKQRKPFGFCYIFHNLLNSDLGFAFC